jgi:hypothetical protein
MGMAGWAFPLYPAMSLRSSKKPDGATFHTCLERSRQACRRAAQVPLALQYKALVAAALPQSVNLCLRCLLHQAKLLAAT